MTDFACNSASMSMKASRQQADVESHYQCYANPVKAEVLTDSEEIDATAGMSKLPPGV